MMQNPNKRLFKPLGILLTNGIGFLVSLIAYIITGINGYYPDDYGTSYLYGDKNLLVITLVFLTLSLLGVILTINTIKNKKTQEYIFPVFLTAASLIFAILMLAIVLKPIKGDFEMSGNYIVAIISAIFALAGTICGGILLANMMSNKEHYQSFILTIVLVACFALSVGLYALVSGITSLKNDVLIGVIYIVIALIQVIGILPMLYGLSDSRTR